MHTSFQSSHAIPAMVPVAQKSILHQSLRFAGEQTDGDEVELKTEKKAPKEQLSKRFMRGGKLMLLNGFSPKGLANDTMWALGLVVAGFLPFFQFSWLMPPFVYTFSITVRMIEGFIAGFKNRPES